MAKTRIQLYLERLGDQMVRFNTFAIKKTGLQQSQTLLQLDDYVLICSPFQLSMKRAVMLVVLSADEVTFFQKFKAKLCKLNFAFLKPGSKIPISFFVRATLERIGAVKGRPNVCMADVSFKACPNDLVQIVGDYITSFGVLKTQYASFKNRTVDVTVQNLPLLAVNPEVDAQFGQLRVKGQILAIGVNRAVLRVSERTPGLAEGTQFAVRFAFSMHQFPAVLVIKAVHGDEEPGYRKIACEMDFYPEMVEVMDAYFHKKRA